MVIVITSMVRGFHNGYPLSPMIEEQAMLSMRQLLSTHMHNHMASSIYCITSNN